MEIQESGMIGPAESAGQCEVNAGSSGTVSEPKRVMGGFTATMIVVASMVGTGVFTTTGMLLEHTPTAPGVLISWLIGGVVAFFGALAYAELVAMYPRNGGEYQLLSRIFHPAVGFVAGWISLIVGFSAPIASAAMAFGKYVGNTFPGLNETVAGISVIAALSLVHAIRVTLGSAVQNVFTVLKLLLVSGFVVGGLALGDFSLLTVETEQSLASTMLSPGFAIGLIYITYAYTGWNGSAYIAGEIKNPTKAVPRALAFGTALVTLIYLGLNTIFLISAPTSQLVGNIDVGAVAANALFGSSIGNVFSTVIALLLVSSLSAMIMAGPRIYQSIGEDYSCLSILNRRKGESGPYVAILLQAVISIVMLVSTHFDDLVTYMGFTLSANAALTVFGIFVMRKRLPKADRPYRCWGYPVTPVLFILLSLWMIVFTFYENPVVALTGTATIAVGVGLYFLCKGKDSPKIEDA